MSTSAILRRGTDWKAFIVADSAVMHGAVRFRGVVAIQPTVRFF